MEEKRWGRRVQAGTSWARARVGVGVGVGDQILLRLFACLEWIFTQTHAGQTHRNFSSPLFHPLFCLHIQETHPPPSTLAKHMALSAGQSRTV